MKKNQSFDQNPDKNLKIEILKNSTEDFSLSPKFIKNRHSVHKLETNKNESDNMFITRSERKDNTNFTLRKSTSPVKKPNLGFEDKFYCPFCEHCNNIKDENLEKYIYTIKESKTIINKGFEYIINSDILSDSDIFRDSKKSGLIGKIDSSKFDVNYIIIVRVFMLITLRIFQQIDYLTKS